MGSLLKKIVIKLYTVVLERDPSSGEKRKNGTLYGIRRKTSFPYLTFVPCGFFFLDILASESLEDDVFFIFSSPTALLFLCLARTKYCIVVQSVSSFFLK